MMDVMTSLYQGQMGCIDLRDIDEFNSSILGDYKE